MDFITPTIKPSIDALTAFSVLHGVSGGSENTRSFWLPRSASF
jgi:hypothetical protein